MVSSGFNAPPRADKPQIAIKEMAACIPGDHVKHMQKGCIHGSK